MIKILFICHGNICRSPMAEFVLRHEAESRGIGELIQTASAATSDEELGNPVHPGTRRKLREHGIGCDGKHAVRLKKSDYAAYDLIVGMDRHNVANMLRIFGGDPEGKVHRLLEFAHRSKDIADPWYTGDFEATWQDVLLGCRALLESLNSDLR